ncbi:MAG: hypothetical protein RI907_23 [Pseudomonadota bacterium]|jgi:hypothetical protein
MATSTRYFLIYSGRGLPLQLAEELQPADLRNRNTWFEASYDAQGRMCRVVKMVYGEAEMRHDYRYNEAGQLVAATITIGDDEPQHMAFAG